MEKLKHEASLIEIEDVLNLNVLLVRLSWHSLKSNKTVTRFYKEANKWVILREDVV